MPIEKQPALPAILATGLGPTHWSDYQFRSCLGTLHGANLGRLARTLNRVVLDKRHIAHQTRKQRGPIRAACRRIDHAFGMWHHAQHAAIGG